MRLVKIFFSVFLLILLFGIALELSQPLYYEIFGLAKPITIIQYSSFLVFMLMLELIKESVKKLDEKYRRILIILGFFFILMTFFEVLWSFGYWFATYELEVANGAPMDAGTLDAAKYYPSPKLDYGAYNSLGERPIINKTAKKHVLFLMMAVYFVYYMKVTRKDNDYTQFSY